MKKFFRLLTCGLVLSLLLCPSRIEIALGQESGYADSAGYEMEISAVTALGLMEGENSIQFFPEDPVDRAELTRIMTRLWNQPLAGDGKQRFYDVPTDYYAFADIDQAVHLGLVEVGEDRIFSPESPATMEEALQMLLKILHYDNYQTASGEEPQFIAKRIGLIEQINSADHQVTKGELARLIYRSFFTGILEPISLDGDAIVWQESDRTTLFYLGLERSEGVVTANDVSSLYYSGQKAPHDTVRMNDILYAQGDSGANRYLGYNVEIFFDDTNVEQKTIRYIHPLKNNETLAINADDISGFSDGSLQYYDSKGKIRKIRVEPEICILYNGVAVESDSNLFLNLDCGVITFLNNGSGSSGTWNVVLIEAYDSFVVQSASEDQQKIYFQKGTLRGQTYLDVYSDALQKVTFWENGVETDFSAVTAGCVIRVAYGMGNSGSNIRVMISTEQQEIVVSGLQNLEDEMIVYSGAQQYQVGTNCVNVEQIEAGKTLRVSLDDMGHILMAETVSDEEEYVCYLKSEYKNLLNRLSVQVLDQNGNLQVLQSESRISVVISGVETKKLPSEVYQLLQDQDVCLLQIIRSEDQLKKIVFAQEAHRDDPLYNENHFTIHHALNGSAQAAYGTLDGVGINGTVTFVVPPADDAGQIDEELCSVSTAYFAPGQNYDNAVFYDVGISGQAGAALVRDIQGAVITDFSSGLLVAEKVIQMVNTEGEVVSAIQGLQSGREITLPVAQKNLQDFADNGAYDITQVSPGDVILFCTNSNGEISGYSVLYASSRDQNTMGQIFVGGNGYSTTRECSVYHGKVQYIDDGAFTLNMNGTLQPMTVENWNNVVVYRCSHSTGKVTIAGRGDIQVQNFYNDIEGAEVVARSNRNVLNEVIIYED